MRNYSGIYGISYRMGQLAGLMTRLCSKKTAEPPEHRRNPLLEEAIRHTDAVNAILDEAVFAMADEKDNP
jgi:hypothetical protein